MLNIRDFLYSKNYVLMLDRSGVEFQFNYTIAAWTTFVSVFSFNREKQEYLIGFEKIRDNIHRTPTTVISILKVPSSSYFELLKELGLILII